MKKPIPKGLNPYYHPYGGWRLISFVSHGDDMRRNYRCTSCKAVYSELTDTCPNCGKQMKYIGEVDESN